MIRRSLAPRDRAASTNSRSLSESTCPRTTRATEAQLKNPMTRIAICRLGLNTDTSATATMMNGTERITSMRRASSVSTQPPKYPEIRPTVTPSTTVSRVAVTPTSNEIRAPYAVRTRMSRPSGSVPKRNRLLGPTGRPFSSRAPLSRYWVFTPWPVQCAISGAMMASRNTRAMTTSEIIATLSLRSRRHASSHGVRPWIASASGS